MMTAIEPALESRTKAAQDTRPTIAADVAHVRRSECGVISARGGAPASVRCAVARSTARARMRSRAMRNVERRRIFYAKPATESTELAHEQVHE